MLDFAAATPGVERVQWQQADALALPFPDRSFDVVACQFGAMFFPDKVDRLPRGAARLAAGRPVCVQRLGPHRGERIHRCRDRRGRRAVPARSAEFSRAHAARLSRQRENPRRACSGRVLRGSTSRRRASQPRRLAARRRDRLLPGNAVAQRDRGPRPVPPWPRRRTRPQPRSRRASVPARSTARYRRS